MEISPIKTRKIIPPKDNIYDILDEYLPKLREKDIIIITSKILAIHQGRCIPVSGVKDKNKLMETEADFVFRRSKNHYSYDLMTLKNNTLIPFAGIDATNGKKHYILWPENIENEAERICNFLKKKNKINDLAIIITDSWPVPMRYGMIGISIGFHGLEPLKEYKDKEAIDLFGRHFTMVSRNIVDSLATMGVFAMGEGNEQTPLAIIRGINSIKFTNQKTNEKIYMKSEEDIYYPLLSAFKNYHE